MFEIQPVEPREHVGASQPRLGRLGVDKVEAEVPIAHTRSLARLEQFVAGILPDRLQQAVARLGLLVRLDDDERLVDELAEDVKHLLG